MELEFITTLSLLIIIYGLFSNYFEKSILTPPILFTLFGLLLGSNFCDLLPTTFYNNLYITTLFEFTLVLVLFVDGAKVDLNCLKKTPAPSRLLVLGIPLSVGFGSLVTYYFFPNLGLWQSVLLATILTPTDAILGQFALENPKVPGKVHTTIIGESGLNDGLVVPIVLFLSVCESLLAGQEYATFWILFFVQQITGAVLIGGLIGHLGGKLLTLACKRGWMTSTFMQLSEASLAFFVFGLCHLLEVNGFIAVFIAGIATQSSSLKKTMTSTSFVVDQKELLILLTFLTFGGVYLAPSLTKISGFVTIYMTLMVVVVRMLSSYISLLGTHFKRNERIFTAWMGPKGTASLVLALIVLNQGIFVEGEILFELTSLCVFFSIVVHGIFSPLLLKRLF